MKFRAGLPAGRQAGREMSENIFYWPKTCIYLHILLISRFFALNKAILSNKIFCLDLT